MEPPRRLRSGFNPADDVHDPRTSTHSGGFEYDQIDRSSTSTGGFEHTGAFDTLNTSWFDTRSNRSDFHSAASSDGSFEYLHESAHAGTARGRHASKGPRVFNRWVCLVGGIVLELCSGVVFGFGSFGHELQQRLGCSEQQKCWRLDGAIRLSCVLRLLV